ncbi:sulfite reductase subunit alpha [Pseudomonas sp. TTU2014-080ASC]|uniref:sulfite reductase subunit alpha n=1 Tax=Pseudomonas sp. TTU2014-080ASC TaxID=1729724 RepID=UPI000B2FF8BA|nr:sulfite reductase flavoprotein subunit alpha [Pseudomonas sp. TTU2014-080ASC]
MQSSRLLQHLILLLTTGALLLLLSLQPAREISAGLVVLSYLLFCLWIWLRHRRPLLSVSSGSITVAYASQSGQAQQLAEKSAEQLIAAGCPAQAVSVDQLQPAHLQGQILFIASTYGEGEAPDSGARFEQLLANQTDLSNLSYAVLALGDRQYTHFCAYGLHLDEALSKRHAQRLFPPLTADQCDAATLSQWQQQLGHISGDFNFADWQAEPFQQLALLERICLNPSSSADKVYELTLSSTGEHPEWQAGDLLEISPRQGRETLFKRLAELNLNPEQSVSDGRTLLEALASRQLPENHHRGLSADELLSALKPLPQRQYSIASVPADGSIQLLVRQMYYPDGRPGIGSGWLCEFAPLGAAIDLRIRVNPSFHSPAASTPMILIGSGTGLAGLRAHLRARPHGSRNWLLFGERSESADFFCRDELMNWKASGHLARLDLAFSRDQAQKIYVQHLLRDAADELREWINQGAAIYLCGSLQGMGQDVHSMLQGLLGEDALLRLQQQDLYRRDLY